MSGTLLSRRDAFKLTAAALMVAKPQLRAARKVIVAGAGIGGLSCAWELVRRGHEVVVLEASDRTGGHVFTFREPLDDGLYADAGAEHFTQPGYERYWSYVNEFQLPHRYYPRRENILRFIGGKMYSPEMLADPKVLEGFGLNRREVEYLKTRPFPELASLYYAPYLDTFRDEYRPFDAGLNHLDQLSTDRPLSERRRLGWRAGVHRRRRFGAAVGVACGHPQVARRPTVSPARLPAGGRESEATRRVCRAPGVAHSSALAGDTHSARADRRSSHVWVRRGKRDPRSRSSCLRDVRGEAANHSRHARMAGREGVRTAERSVLFRLARDLPVAHAVLETRSHQPEHGVW